MEAKDEVWSRTNELGHGTDKDSSVYRNLSESKKRIYKKAEITVKRTDYDSIAAKRVNAVNGNPRV